jgi:hypothetical protein
MPERAPTTEVRVAGGGPALMLVLLLGIALPALALAQQSFGRVTRFEGRATITRAGTVSPAVLYDPVLSGDRITLGPESRMRVLLGEVASLTAHPFSELIITEEPNGTSTTVNGGRVIFDVNETKLKPGEVHEIRTPVAVVQMRGARVAVTVGPGGTQVDCVSGEVLVAVEDRPLAPCLPGRGFTIKFGSP